MFEVITKWNLSNPKEEMKDSIANIKLRGYHSDTFLTGEFARKIRIKEIKALSLNVLVGKYCPTRRDLYFEKGIPHHSTLFRFHLSYCPVHRLQQILCCFHARCNLLLVSLSGYQFHLLILIFHQTSFNYFQWIYLKQGHTFIVGSIYAYFVILMLLFLPSSVFAETLKINVPGKYYALVEQPFNVPEDIPTNTPGERVVYFDDAKFNELFYGQFDYDEEGNSLLG